jgi:hypothetical protein
MSSCRTRRQPIDHECDGGIVRRSEDYYATLAGPEENEAELLPLVEFQAPGGSAASDWRLHFGAACSIRLTAMASRPN